MAEIITPPGFFSATLFILVLACIALIANENRDATKVKTSPEFRRFQKTYLVVYTCAVLGDWLQGPYVYALYSMYNFSKLQIGQLFIAGFGSSMVFGIAIGSMTDRYGRKASCLAYCLTYILSCMTKHYSSFLLLMVGRILGGISYSILFTSFDSWLIAEHNRRGFPSEWLNQTFQFATVCNGLAAIAAGQIGSWVRDSFDSLVAPFDAAIAFLAMAAVIISISWGENRGGSNSAQSVGTESKLKMALTLLGNDPRFIVLGLIQSFFEAAMYIVVFMWTPRLEPYFSYLPHGQVFGCFMACTMMGSCCVGALTKLAQPESYLRWVFVLSAACMAVPSFGAAGGYSILMSLYSFEFLCGVFWPSKGILKSQYVPEEVRATMYNTFRVPLNLIICLVLSNLDKTSDQTVFAIVCLLLVAAAFMQNIFYILVTKEGKDERGDNNAGGKPGTIGADDDVELDSLLVEEGGHGDMGKHVDLLAREDKGPRVAPYIHRILGWEKDSG